MKAYRMPGRKTSCILVSASDGSSSRITFGERALFTARFEVFTAVLIQFEFFWVVRPCSVVGYQRFRGPCSSIFKVK
jgi:hypothetical protein